MFKPNLNKSATMKSAKWYVAATSLFLIGCGSGEKTVEQRKANGKYVYGGNIVTAETEKYISLFPMGIVDASSARIADQLHDGLVTFNAVDLSLQGAIAKDWEISPDQKVYTFTLRDDAYFHDDECFEGGIGRKVTAKDFVFAFELLCDPNKNFSNYDNLFKNSVVGAEEFHSGKVQAISGIKAIDDHTLQVSLTQPNASFIYAFASPATVAIAKEAYDKYGEDLMVGAGPYMFASENEETEATYLTYHPKYYAMDDENNRLPYTDSLTFMFFDNKLDEFDAFDAGTLSFVDGLPSSKITEVVQENINHFEKKPPIYELVIEPEAVSHYYEFNLSKPPFDNILVRKAFNYAINRKRLVENSLKGQGLVANYGLVPYRIRAFNDYPYDSITGYDFQPEMAQQLLAEAGYPDGNGFPEIKLEINAGGNINSRVATEIEQQLRAILGINISIETVPFSQKIEDSKYGRAEWFRSAWVADFPSPETFLSICYGGNVPASMDEPSHPNTMRYVNAKFDSLYLKALQASDRAEKMSLLAQAEQIMIQDAPLMLLWYGEDYKLIRANVQNYYHNSLNHIDFSRIFLKTLSEEEYKELKGIQ